MGKERYRFGDRTDSFLKGIRRSTLLSVLKGKQPLDFSAFALIASSRLTSNLVGIGLLIGSGIFVKAMVEIATHEAELDNKQRQNDDLINSQTFSSCLRDISLAIEESRTHSEIGFDEKIREIRRDLLRLMVVAAEDITRVPSNKTCANLMLPEFNQNTQATVLKLHGFSQRDMGRGVINPIIVDETNPSPGAVTAFTSGVTQYIENTDDFPEQFIEKHYKSFLSYPILLDGASKAIGVVNIDSEAPYAFHDFDNEEVIENLTKIISPWLQAISLTVTLQNKESNRVTRTNL